MSQESLPTPPPSFGKRMRNAFAAFLRAIIRLFAIALTIGLLILIFIGVPALYRQYIVPVSDNIQSMQETQILLEQTNQRLTQQLDEMNRRVNALEIRRDSDRQAIGDLGARLGSIPSTQQAQLDSLRSTQTAANDLLVEINSSLASLEKRLAEISNQLGQANSAVSALDEKIGDLESRLESEEAPLVVLQRELQMVKAMELLTRSRVFLVHNNFGLAAEDIQAARSLLVSLQVPDFQEQALAEIITRLDNAVEYLPEAPVLAAEELEIAWQLLRSGLPGSPLALPTVEATTPAPTLATEPAPSTPTPTSTLTPTP